MDRSPHVHGSSRGRESCMTGGIAKKKTNCTATTVVEPLLRLTTCRGSSELHAWSTPGRHVIILRNLPVMVVE